MRACVQRGSACAACCIGSALLALTVRRDVPVQKPAAAAGKSTRALLAAARSPAHACGAPSAARPRHRSRCASRARPWGAACGQLRGSCQLCLAVAAVSPRQVAGMQQPPGAPLPLYAQYAPPPGGPPPGGVQGAPNAAPLGGIRPPVGAPPPRMPPPGAPPPGAPPYGLPPGARRRAIGAPGVRGARSCVRGVCRVVNSRRVAFPPRAAVPGLTPLPARTQAPSWRRGRRACARRRLHRLPVLLLAWAWRLPLCRPPARRRVPSRRRRRACRRRLSAWRRRWRPCARWASARSLARARRTRGSRRVDEAQNERTPRAACAHARCRVLARTTAA
jgi:hypothetical protein